MPIICSATVVGVGRVVLAAGGGLLRDLVSHMRPGPMNAGETALTRMPAGARSFAAAFVRPITAALEAE